MKRDRERDESGDRDFLSGLVPISQVGESPGLGDIPGLEFDPHQRREIQEHGQLGPEYNEIIRADRKPLAPDVKDDIAEKARLFTDVLFFSKIFVRRPNYLDPPLSAKLIDIYTDPFVTVIAGATDQLILRYSVPKGAVAVVKKMGNDLDTPAAFPLVTWRLQFALVNKTPNTRWFDSTATQQQTFINFNRQIGDPTCPCPLPMPLVLFGPGFFEIRADNPDIVAHDLEFRFQGWEWTPEYSSTRTDINAEFQL